MEKNLDVTGPETSDHVTPHRHEVVLDIATPKGPFIGEFSVEVTVASVIEIVINDKNLDRKDTFELVYGEKVLQPTDRTLGSFGLRGKVELELVATGSGV